LTQRRQQSKSRIKSKDESAELDEEVHMKRELDVSRRLLKRKCKEFIELESRRLEKRKKKP
jgi:hypothetical protein